MQVLSPSGAAQRLSQWRCSEAVPVQCSEAAFRSNRVVGSLHEDPLLAAHTLITTLAPEAWLDVVWIGFGAITFTNDYQTAVGCSCVNYLLSFSRHYTCYGCSQTLFFYCSYNRLLLCRTH